MKPEDHLTSVAADIALINEVANSADLDTTVPGCAPWTIEDLLVHLSQVWSFVAASIKIDQAADRSVSARPEGEQGAAPTWHAASSKELLDTLRGRSPEEKTWAFDLPETDIAFWCRRMCHEASIHRHDLHTAAGNAQPVDHDVAVDGIDELLDYFIPNRKPTAFAGNGETLHFHSTSGSNDGGSGSGEWFITRTADGMQVERKHAKADVAARGTASDLLLMLWGRKSPAELEVFGDAALLDAWQEKLQF